jgi:hypothetical protein
MKEISERGHEEADFPLWRKVEKLSLFPPITQNRNK